MIGTAGFDERKRPQEDIVAPAAASWRGSHRVCSDSEMKPANAHWSYQDDPGSLQQIVSGSRDILPTLEQGRGSDRALPLQFGHEGKIRTIHTRTP